MNVQAKILAAAALSITTFAGGAYAEKPVPPPTIKITDAWAKTTVPGGAVSAAYMQIKSSKPVKLINAESDAANIVEIHDMKMNDGVMEMKALDAVEVPANKTIELKPGGTHIMLIKTKHAIKVGDKVPLVLTFEDVYKRTFTVNVDATGKDKTGQEKKTTAH